MRQDILVGVVVSGLIHAGLFLQSLVSDHRVPAPPPPEPKQVIKLEMPKFEPEDPEPVAARTDEARPIDLAPVSQQDLPQPTTDLSFVQRLQPPLPDNITPTANLMRIPERRGATEFGQLPYFDPASLDQQPVAKVRTPPPYPPDMRRLGATGEVIVDFIVDANGNVQNARAISSTNREFERAAEQGVSRWKFKPGRKSGRAVNTHMQVPILFNLDNS